ncbi:unnamed protein product (macronuclear) [Paramecium tetraurelia]|uniref:Uncharacterized protein n=1 Tax=Paramecium tetraurelia TaxID=5888 RepID=A0CAG5_PARTE|nr:uncharacterized protein GSPATT00036562001 [Paramecium tetraurelia]CAK67782.1 unnamed protein product [Paramecium tetraurelia]|eukprot:XP_001435179.1 hypothetical protein (macronuclear) [Paramecium tetraurelia strain d4-2]
MQYHVSKQDVLGTLQDVFLQRSHQLNNLKHSHKQKKPPSAIKAKLDPSTSKNKLERYLEKYQQRKQLQEENNSSLAQSIQNTNMAKLQQKLNDSQTAYSSKMSLPRESTENDDKEQQLIGVGLSQYMQQLQRSKLQSAQVNQECQTESQKEQVDVQSANGSIQDNNQSSNSVGEEIKILNTKHVQWNTHNKQIQLGLQLETGQHIKQDFSCQFNTEIKLNQLIENQQIKQICQNNQEIKLAPQNDFGCQFNQSNNQISIILQDQCTKNTRTKNRCLTSASRKDQNNQLNSNDQITFLEQELQLRDEMLETKTRTIADLQQQLNDFYQIFSKESDIEQDNGQQDLNLSSEHWKVDELNRQSDNDEDQLTSLMLKQSEEIQELKRVLDEAIEAKKQLSEEQEELIIQIKQCKQKLIDVEESKAREIDCLNQDYQDKLSKQNMIMDELQSQICSIQTSPTEIPLNSNQITVIHPTQEQSIDERDSFSSQGKTKNVLKHINKMSIMTAGWMSNKQDYVTLGVLGRIDQTKSQTKLDSFKKLN